MFRGRTCMWIIAKTKSNQEKKANVNLINQGFTTYLPILKRKKFLKNQWVLSKSYLFSGYIFINKDDAHGKYQKINNTYGISRVLIDFDTFIAPLDYSLIKQSNIKNLDWIMTLGGSVLRPISKFIISSIQFLQEQLKL